MNVKIAMLVAASEYERVTLDAARSSAMELATYDPSPGSSRRRP
jgi:hypothetical protein